MPKNGSNYFRYLLPAPEQALWGMSVTAAGFTHVPAGASYPLSKHPADHDLAWDRGRVLEAVQIVLIESGRGVFETREGGQKRVEAGTAFAVVPGTWHRYRPDPATGWDESWVEVQGPVLDKLRRKGLFDTATVVRGNAFLASMDKALDEVHALARMGTPGFQPELSARAYGVVAAWAQMDGKHSAPTRLTRAVLKAEQHLAEHFTEPVNVEKLARQLGVAYSHFRRAFRTHTGYAPWQYILRLRLGRARRQLVSGEDATLEEIATRLGFSSGFHFSTTFKHAFGVSPDQWRRQMRGDRPHPAPAPKSGTRPKRANWTKSLRQE